MAPGPGTGSIRGWVQDESGRPLVYANIHGKGEAWGGFSRDDGAYRIDNVPAGTYTLKCALIGYQSHEVERVKVKAGQVVTVDFRLKDGPPQTLSSVEVWAYPREGSSGKDGAASKIGRASCRERV